MCNFLKEKYNADNLAIDDKLIEKAQLIGKHKTKKAVVTKALQECIQRKKQMQILNLFGKVDYDPDYVYKKQRQVQWNFISGGNQVWVKEYDCVEMKNKAAEKIKKKIAGLTPKEELTFWKNQTESLRKRQRELSGKQKIRP